MECDICHEREAAVNLKQVVNGEWTTLRLCAPCAAERGLETPASIAATPLGSFLAAMGKDVPGAPSGDTCTRCGATLQDFRTSQRLGCPECYRVFDAALRELLRRVHGATRHTGERYATLGAPAAGEPEALEATTLRAQLDAAIAAENFELAADLRDRLRALQ